jgi:hypothetical protein
MLQLHFDERAMQRGKKNWELEKTLINSISSSSLLSQSIELGISKSSILLPNFKILPQRP